MAARLSRFPVVKTLPLSKFDPSGDTTVTVRQATAGDLRRLADLNADTEYIYDDAQSGQTRMKRNVNLEDVKMQRAFSTVQGCNLINDEANQPWFTFPATEFTFEDEWDALPPEVAEEIYAQVLVVNPEWDPKRKGE